VVLDGAGQLDVGPTRHPLRPHTLALIPRGAPRSIRAGSSGITYVTVHRSRGPLRIGASPHGGDQHRAAP
jgi:hypothetical protein